MIFQSFHIILQFKKVNIFIKVKNGFFAKNSGHIKKYQHTKVKIVSGWTYTDTL